MRREMHAVSVEGNDWFLRRQRPVRVTVAFGVQ